MNSTYRLELEWQFERQRTNYECRISQTNDLTVGLFYCAKIDRRTAQQANALDCYTNSRLPRIRYTNSDSFLLTHCGNQLTTEMDDR